MGDNKNERRTLAVNLEKLILEFQDSEKVRGIPKEIFPLVITAAIFSFDVFSILIDCSISNDIMYSDLFENMKLKKENL